MFNSCEQYMRYRPTGKCDNMLLARACRENASDLSIQETSLCRSSEHSDGNQINPSL
jgi:hypothetical protein